MTTKPQVVRQQQTDQLYDGTTGEHVGQIDLFGREQYHLLPDQQRSIVAPGDLSGVLYDVNSRVLEMTIDGVTYTLNYSTTQIRIKSSDSYNRTVTLDPLGRISASVLSET